MIRVSTNGLGLRLLWPNSFLSFVLQYSRMLFPNTFTGVLQSSAACWMQARRLTVSTISLFFSCYSNGRSLSQSYVFSFSGTNPCPCRFAGTRLCPPALVLLANGVRQGGVLSPILLQCAFK